MSFSFARPEWLWLLLALPVLWAVTLRSRRQFGRARWAVVVPALDMPTPVEQTCRSGAKTVTPVFFMPEE